MSFAEAMEALRTGFSERASTALCELLERKHLYQNVHVQFDQAFILECASKAPSELRERVLSEGQGLQDAPWYLPGSESVDYSLRGFPAGFTAGATGVEGFKLSAPDLKLYCGASRCRRVEPFNAADCTDVFGRAHSSARPIRQMFVLRYVCQSCKGEPTVFLVRREGLKLTLVGRSPIEHVEVPRAIPRTIERFYSGAVVAHQSGQTLAGNFLLRTLIEQWVRSFPPAAALRAEPALDWYYSQLPDDFKQRFPSLRGIYEELSDDIHAAKGDEQVFTSASSRLTKHFEAWRLFELDQATFGSGVAEADTPSAG